MYVMRVSVAASLLRMEARICFVTVNTGTLMSIVENDIRG